MPDKIVYGTMTGNFMDPLKVVKDRLRKLRWVNKHWKHELLKDDRARGGPQVHENWLQQSGATWSEADRARRSWQ